MSLSVTQHVKHVPKHRQVSSRPSPLVASRTAARTVLVLSSVAVVGTGVAVAGGSLALSSGAAPGAAVVAAGTPAQPAESTSETPSAAALAEPSTPEPSTVAPAVPAQVQEDLEVERDERSAGFGVVSRSDRRGVADPAKAAALSMSEGNLMDRAEDSSDADPRTIAAALLGDYGFSGDQMGCLDNLWTKESGWSVTADNPSSSAYGIPQALPGSKMSTAGADWATNPVTQIRWGLGYIEDRYGSPCGAWSHSVSNNWY